MVGSRVLSGVLLSSVLLRSVFRSRNNLGNLGNLRSLVLLHGGLELLLRSGGEVGLLDLLGRGLGRGLATTQHLLSLGGVISHKTLGKLGGVSSVGSGYLLELVGLSLDKVLRILEVVVDKLLVRGVDQGDGEEEGGGEEGKTPVGNNLDEPVRQESANSDLGLVSVKSLHQPQVECNYSQ